MRLKEWSLNEQREKERQINDEMFEEVYNNADWEYLKACKKSNSFLYRGSRRKIDTFEEITRSPSYERQPLAMNLEIYKKFNKAYLKVFGWEVRKGVFTTSSKLFAGMFEPMRGGTYIFVPTSGTNFVWSKNIMDLNDWMHGNINEFIMMNDEQAEKMMKKFYQDTNLYEAILSTHEVIFNSKTYYLVNSKYGEYLL